MTVSQDPIGATELSHVIVRPANVDAFSRSAWCPVCGNAVEDRSGVHRIPSDVVTGGKIGGVVSVFGYRCDRHRQPHVLVAPFTVAPDSFESMELEIGDSLQAGRPGRAADGGGRDD